MFQEMNCKCEIVKNFLPSWFAANMGTGILAIVTLAYSKYIPFFKILAYYMFYFNLVLFFALLIPWFLRWILFPKNAIADLKHPILSNFYPTVSVAMLVIATGFIIIIHNMPYAEIFWITGALLTFAFGIYIPYISFMSENIKLEHINPAWFIPPVGLIVIPIAGAKIAVNHLGIYGEFLNIINFISWGSGFFLYLALLAVIIYRLILHTPMPGALIPTIWINLGPIGAGTISLLGIATTFTFLTDKSAIYFLGFIFWGFGIWWVLVAIFLTLHYIKKLNLKYEMSWWAFIFPLGAFVGATHNISSIFKIEVIDYIGFVLYFLLFFLWLITLSKTLYYSFSGKVFKR